MHKLARPWCPFRTLWSAISFAVVCSFLPRTARAEAVPGEEGGASPETIAHTISGLDTLLSNTPPEQDVVYVDDMGFRASFLRSWVEHLRGIATGRAPKAVFDLSVSVWKDGVVPYLYDPSMTAALSNRFEASIREWQMAANLKFIPRTTEANYLVISNSLPGGPQNSFVGMQGGKQLINVNAAALANLDCAHEIGHALGMEHEQTRSDRDTYVKIHWENFKAGYPTNTSNSAEPNFGILPSSVSDNATSYDYDSIMEYPAWDGNSARNPGDKACSDAACSQIEPLDPYWSAAGRPALGQNPPTSHLSPLDKYGMGVRYGLPRTISGHVYQVGGAALAGVTVNISGGSSYRGPASVVTSADGSFSFVGIPNNTGTFTITANLSGHYFVEGNWTVNMRTTDLTTADFHEDAPPTLSFSPLTNQDKVFDLAALGGTVSKASTVTFRITEYNTTSANRYWDGSNWILDENSPTVLLPATVNSSLVWSPAATLPGRAQTRPGFYVIDAYATDRAGSQGSANLAVNRTATDSTTPSTTLATVNPGQVLAASSLPSLVGTASAPGSGIATVDVYLMRATNPGFVYWTGTTWSSDATALHATYDENAQVWDVSLPLPSDLDLPNASYQIQVTASNRESPPGSSTSTTSFTVNVPNAPSAITVPGTANPWLAGMPDGFSEPGGDSAPGQSPVLFTNFTAGAWLQFSASGSASYGGDASGPTGLSGTVNHGAEDGIGAINNSPVNALIGVFLDDTQPDPSASTPDPFDFGSGDLLNYVLLQPALKQPFFVGSGINAGGVHQTVVTPAGATRLFLGIQDGYGWYNNSGSFAVLVKPLAPLPPITSASATPAGAPIVSGTSWSFTASYSASAPGLRLRVQSSLTPHSEGSWTDLPGVPYMSPAGSNWTLNTSDVPPGPRSFRVLGSAPGYGDARSTVLGPFAVGVGDHSGSDWDAGADLKINELLGLPLAAVNPNPVVTNWAYGHRLEADLATTNFTLLEAHGTNNWSSFGAPNLWGWFDPAHDGPATAANVGTDPLVISFCCGPLLPVGPAEMALWPGNDGSAAVVRWTAPETAGYAVSTYWRKIDVNGNNGCISSVVKNGTVLYTQTWFNGDTPGYTNLLALTAGDVLDFVLGPAGSYSFDGTRFNATIHLASAGILPPIPSISVSAAAAPIQPDTSWTFSANYSTLVSGLKLRVQATLTPDDESSWTDLPGNPYMTHLDATWTLHTSGAPEGDVFFRIIASAPEYSDGRSAVVGPFRVSVPLPVVTHPVSASRSYALEDVAELQNPALLQVHAPNGVSASFTPSTNVFTGLANLLLAADPGGAASLAIKEGQLLQLPSLGLGQAATLFLQGTFSGDLQSGVLNPDALGVGAANLLKTPAAQSFLATGTLAHDPTSLQVLALELKQFVSQKLSSFFTGTALDQAQHVSLKTSGLTQPAFTGLMTVDGNYDQFSGTLLIGIAGTNTAAQGGQEYDQLLVKGTANLNGGSIAVGLFNPDDQTNRTAVFLPPAGATFDVVVASNIVAGSDLTVRGPLWGDGVFFNWGIVTRPDGWQALRLVAAAYPPVLTLQVAGAGLELSYPTNYVGYTLQSTPSLSPAVWTTLSTGVNDTVVSATNSTRFFRLSKP